MSQTAHRPRVQRQSAHNKKRVRFFSPASIVYAFTLYSFLFCVVCLCSFFFQLSVKQQVYQNAYSRYCKSDNASQRIFEECVKHHQEEDCNSYIYGRHASPYLVRSFGIRHFLSQYRYRNNNHDVKQHIAEYYKRCQLVQVSQPNQHDCNHALAQNWNCRYAVFRMQFCQTI